MTNTSMQTCQEPQKGWHTIPFLVVMGDWHSIGNTLTMAYVLQCLERTKTLTNYQVVLRATMISMDSEMNWVRAQYRDTGVKFGGTT
mmetsp:Transcript_953/g.1774  ORF Transcript_953/g.1774 Transcript_953/m.1774 type:complete len:87 (+) Transcript_953:51-311(+)